MLDVGLVSARIDTLASAQANAILSCCGLDLQYGRRRVFSDVSFDLFQQETLCLIGSQENGKSSLLRCLNRTAELDRGACLGGRIFLDRRDVFDPSWDVTFVRRQVALVPQVSNPFPASIWDNIAYVLKLHRIASGQRDIGDRIEKALCLVGIWDEVKDDLHKTPVHQMAPVIQRQVCIARALALEPRVLLLDEPSVGLGGLSMQQLEMMLLRLKQNLAIVVATQSLEVAAQIADRIGHLDQGTMQEVDCAELILTNAQNPVTRRFVEAHAQGLIS